MQHLVCVSFSASACVEPKICRAGWLACTHVRSLCACCSTCSWINAVRLPGAWHFFLPLPYFAFPFPPQARLTLVSIKVNVSAHTFVRLWFGRPRAFTSSNEEGEGIHLDRPPTTAAGRLARHGEIICFPILDCWTLVVPAVSVKHGWSCITQHFQKKRTQQPWGCDFEGIFKLRGIRPVKDL